MRTDPNPTRLLFAPTARALPRGRGYVALYEVVMPFVTVAASDRFLLSGGTPYVPGAIGKVWWFAPKLNVLSRGDTDLALGTLAFAFEDETAGILYLVGTKGSPDRAVSGALGYGFADGALADTPALMLGLEQRVSESVKLISESYYFDGEGLLGFGVRFFGTRLSADVGIGFATAAVDSWAPLVNFAYSW